LPQREGQVARSLIQDARARGPRHADVVRRVHDAVLNAAATGAKAVVCTCSTIGEVAEGTPTGGRFLAVRIDRAMADRAASLGPVVLVVAALESTLEPTSDLVQDSARRLGVAVQVRPALVEDAWPHFERGNKAAYLDAVARGVRRALPGPNVVVLAQASMADAVVQLRDVGIEVLASPVLGVQNILERLTGRDRVSDGRQ